MGLFDDILPSSKSKELSKHDAFAGILMLANASDGHVSDEEVRGFLTVLLRMKLYNSTVTDFRFAMTSFDL